jgi:hypothetical protein
MTTIRVYRRPGTIDEVPDLLRDLAHREPPNAIRDAVADATGARIDGIIFTPERARQALHAS